MKADGDADDDFDVDQTDLAIWRGMFGTAAPAGSSEVTVAAALTISSYTLEPPRGAEEANGDDFAAAAGWIALDSLLPYSIRSNKTTTYDVSAVTSLKAASFAAIGISPLPAVVAESPPASGPTEATSNSSQHALEVLDAAFAENVLNPLNEIFFLPA